MAALRRVAKRSAKRVNPSGVISGRSVIFSFVHERFSGAECFHVQSFRRNVVVIQRVVQLHRPLTLFRRPSRRVGAAITCRHASVPHLCRSQQRRERRLFVRGIVRRFFVGQFQPTILVRMGVLPIRFLRCFKRCTVMFTLLSIRLFHSFNGHLFNFHPTFFNRILFRSCSPILNGPCFMGLFRVKQVSQRRLSALVSERHFVLHFRRGTVIRKRPTGVAFGMFV